MGNTLEASVRPEHSSRIPIELVFVSLSALFTIGSVDYPKVALMTVASLAVLTLSMFYSIALPVIFILLVALMPKLPLIPIRGYMVPIRIVDVFLAFALVMAIARTLFVGGKLRGHFLAGRMLAFLVVEGLSLVFALAFLSTISNPTIGVLYWLRSLEYFSASILTLLAVRTWRHFRLVLAAFALSTLLVGIYGILQEFSLVPAFNAMHQSGQIVAIYYMEGFGAGRLISTFGGAYDLAAFYLIAVPILVALGFSSRSRWTRSGLGVVVCLSLLCLYLTFARAPLLSMAVGLGVTFWLMGRQRLSIILACLLPWPALLIAGFKARLLDFFTAPSESVSVYGRVSGEWLSAIHGFLRSPILGTGPTSVGNGMGVDGLYVLLLGMTGILGLVVFLRLVRSALQIELRLSECSGDRLLKALATGLAAGTVGLLINGVTQDTFFSSKVALPYWFLVGLLLAGVRLEGAVATRRSLRAGGAGLPRTAVSQTPKRPVHSRQGVT